MKKTYINPQIEVISIKAQQLLSGSATPGFNASETSSTMDSRNFTWDDWDE